MNRSVDWKKGMRAGLKTSWELSKIVLPIAIVIQVAKQTPVLEWVTERIAPFMSVFGLSGEAAIPLVLGNVLNLYAALGAMQAVDLTVKQAFILAVMLSFSHNMFIESAVCRRVGVATWAVITVRMGLAVVSALIINWTWAGGGEPITQGVLAPVEHARADGWVDILLTALYAAAEGVLQLVVIVLPLMVVLQALKDVGFLDRVAQWIMPLLKPLSISGHGAIAMATGLFAGLFLGAGLIIQEAEERNFSKRDMTLIMIFLAACHAVVEDTLIFVPLGIPVIYLLLIRLLAAIAVTLVVARLLVNSGEEPLGQRMQRQVH
ncbi:nucleoside recognition domain-containing protein [Laceyella tengchongensis]